MFTSIIPKLIYRFSVIPIETPANVFVEIKLILIQMERQGTSNSQNDFENKELVGVLPLWGACPCLFLSRLLSGVRLLNFKGPHMA